MTRELDDNPYLPLVENQSPEAREQAATNRWLGGAWLLMAFPVSPYFIWGKTVRTTSGGLALVAAIRAHIGIRRKLVANCISTGDVLHSFVASTVVVGLTSAILYFLGPAAADKLRQPKQPSNSPSLSDQGLKSSERA